MGRGAHDYFRLDKGYTGQFGHPMYRGLEEIDDEGYLTTRITEEAVSFIKRHKDQPFLAYVAYNAVHAPPQAPKEDIALFDTGDKQRDILMAMLKHLDLGVGKIVQTLKDAGVYDNTLLLYLSDNGGSGVMHANNAPLRGFKQDDYEGGIRVPFIVSWPNELEGGTTCSVPLSSIDILPTVLAATGIAALENKPLDGKNMLPALKGEADTLHEHMFWSSGPDGTWAVRSGDWKLVHDEGEIGLFNLSSDIGEATDLKGKYPEMLSELTRRYNTWLDEMAEPVDGQSSKRWAPGQKSPKQQRKKAADKAGQEMTPEEKKAVRLEQSLRNNR